MQLQIYASIFSIIDKKIFDTRLEEIKTLCRDINSRLATIGAHEVIIESDGRVTIGINGSTVNGVAASCVVAGSLTNTTRFSLVSYT